MAKERVAPLKQITLPKLELMAAVIAAKLAHLVIESLCLKVITYMWTDSQIVLCWIHSTKTLPSFVKHQVKTISKCYLATLSIQWQSHRPPYQRTHLWPASCLTIVVAWTKLVTWWEEVAIMEHALSVSTVRSSTNSKRVCLSNTPHSEQLWCTQDYYSRQLQLPWAITSSDSICSTFYCQPQAMSTI